MKRTPKPVFFIVAILILVLSYTAVFGVYTRYGDRTDTVIRSISEIRWGIDIQGGVDVTFGPKDDGVDTTTEQLDAVKTIIEQRLVSKNITDYEAYTDAANDQVIVRFPWNSTEKTPQEAVAEIGQTAMLAFRIGSEKTGELVLTGDDVAEATAGYVRTSESASTGEYVVQLKLKESGREAFAKATEKQKASGGTISIWLDDTKISDPKVSSVITDGNASISGSDHLRRAAVRDRNEEPRLHLTDDGQQRPARHGDRGRDRSGDRDDHHDRDLPSARRARVAFSARPDGRHGGDDIRVF